MRKNTPRSLTSLFLLGIIFVALIPHPLYSSIAQAQLGEPEYYRGSNFETWTYPNGTVKWQSASEYVWNSSDWVPYIFQDLYSSEGKYVVQTGLIGAEIYDYYAKFYNPDMTEVRLYDERWEVEKWKTSGKGGWETIGAQSGTPIYKVTQDSDGINVTKSFHSWAGWLNITYIFHRNLKHTVVWKSEIVSDETFRVLQKWSGIVGDKVKHSQGENNITEATLINSSWFKFQKADGNLTVFEDQRMMEQYLQPVIINTHAQGMKADFIFANWTLSTDEKLVVDPTTETLYVESFDSTYTEWLTSGTSPYIDDSNDYIYTSVNDAREGYFSFSDISGSVQSLTSVTISCEVKALAANLLIDVFIYNGSWYNVGTLTGITNVYTYKTIDISNTLDTVLKIDNATVYFQADLPTAYNVFIRRSKLVVVYTPTPDTESPQYSDVGVDSTYYGNVSLFYAKWTDNVSIHGYIFGTNNTGSWSNDTWVESTGTPMWSNVSKTLNEEVGVRIEWQFWVNDTSDNWNSTGLQYFSVSGDEPSYTPSWLIPTWHGDGWGDMKLVHDNDTSTYVSTFIEDGWSTYCYLVYYYTIQSDKIRYYLSPPVYGNDVVDVDVKSDGNWVDVYQGTWSTGWTEKSFTVGVVSEARLRVYNQYIAGPPADEYRFHELQFWGWKPVTSLSGTTTLQNVVDKSGSIFSKFLSSLTNIFSSLTHFNKFTRSINERIINIVPLTSISLFKRVMSQLTEVTDKTTRIMIGRRLPITIKASHTITVWKMVANFSDYYLGATIDNIAQLNLQFVHITFKFTDLLRNTISTARTRTVPRTINTLINTIHSFTKSTPYITIKITQLQNIITQVTKTVTRYIAPQVGGGGGGYYVPPEIEEEKLPILPEVLPTLVGETTRETVERASMFIGFTISVVFVYGVASSYGKKKKKGKKTIKSKKGKMKWI